MRLPHSPTTTHRVLLTRVVPSAEKLMEPFGLGEHQTSYRYSLIRYVYFGLLLTGTVMLNGGERAPRRSLGVSHWSAVWDHKSDGPDSLQTCMERKTLPAWQGPSQPVYGRDGVRIHETEGIRVFEVEQGQSVIDLTCRHKWARAFYHRLIDCFIPSISTLRYGLTHPDAVVVVPNYMLDIYKYFLEDVDSRRIRLHGTRKKYAFNITSAQDVEMVYTCTGRLLSDEAHRKNLAFMLDKVRASKHEAAHATLIDRACSGRRCFPDTTILQRAFAEGLGMPVVIYHGNESFAQTVDLFSRSRVIIAYHGAGLANAIFSPRGSVVLEYTTFEDMEGKRMWRTNSRVASLHGDMTWLTHTIDIDRLTDLRKLAKRSDRGHYIKWLPYVNVTAAVVYNSVQRIRREIDNPRPRGSHVVYL